jgi:arylsulfatase A-like enzyme
VLENTLLIFLADHGDYAGDYGLQRKGVGMPECLVRVPLIMAGPGIPAELVARTDFVSLVDVFPTMCEMLGVELPYGVQGRSLWPMLTGDDYPAAEFRSIYAESGFGGLPYTEGDDPPLHFPEDGQSFDELNSFTQSGNTKMVRMGPWKLLYDVLGQGELYDLSDDPAELINRFDDPAYSRVRMRVVEELLTWTIRTEDDLPSAQYIPKRAEHNWHAPYRETHSSTGQGIPRNGRDGRVSTLLLRQ